MIVLKLLSQGATGSRCFDSSATIMEWGCYHHIARREVYHFRGKRGSDPSYFLMTKRVTNEFCSSGYVQMGQ